MLQLAIFSQYRTATGRKEEALAKAVDAISIDPKFSLDRFAKTLTCKNQAEMARRA